MLGFRVFVDPKHPMMKQVELSSISTRGRRKRCTSQRSQRDRNIQEHVSLSSTRSLENSVGEWFPVRVQGPK